MSLRMNGHEPTPVSLDHDVPAIMTSTVWHQMESLLNDTVSGKIMYLSAFHMS